MENLNIPPFVYGDKAVFVGKTEGGLVNGKIYRIDKVIKQPCGCWAVDVLHYVHFVSKEECKCDECGKEFINSYCTKSTPLFDEWLSATEFRKVQEQKMKQVSFSKLLEECPVGVN